MERGLRLTDIISYGIATFIRDLLQKDPNLSEQQCYDIIIKLTPEFKREQLFNSLFPSIFKIEKLSV